MAAQVSEDQQQDPLNQSAPQTRSTTVPIKPKRNAVLNIAIVLLFLLAVGGLVYVSYQNYLLRQESGNANEVKSVPEQKPQPVQDSQRVEGEIIKASFNGWNTYQGKVYTFDFPSSWQITSFGYNDSSPIRLESVDGNISFDLQLNIVAGVIGQGPPGIEPIKTVELNISGIKSLRRDYKGAQFNSDCERIIEIEVPRTSSGNYDLIKFMVESGYESEGEKIIGDIISSLKITE